RGKLAFLDAAADLVRGLRTVILGRSLDQGADVAIREVGAHGDNRHRHRSRAAEATLRLRTGAAFRVCLNEVLTRSLREEKKRMLEGLKVIEYATYVAAPGAGGIMADWGADVIKVEPPGGDPIRMFFASAGVDEEAINPIFEMDNRGKRGIILD